MDYSICGLIRDKFSKYYNSITESKLSLIHEWRLDTEVTLRNDAKIDRNDYGFSLKII